MNIYNSNCFVNDVLILKRKILICLCVARRQEVGYSMKLLDQVRDTIRKKHHSKEIKLMKLTSSAFEQVEKAMEGHLLAETQLMGRYKRLS